MAGAVWVRWSMVFAVRWDLRWFVGARIDTLKEIHFILGYALAWDSLKDYMDWWEWYFTMLLRCHGIWSPIYENGRQQ